jgi:hypothetical protein
MTDDNWKTLRVPPEAYETAKAQKDDAGRTWGEQVVAPVTPDVTDYEDLAARIVDQIGADAGGPQVDDTEIARAVARELDYAHLADKVSEQVVREIEAQR